MAVTLPWLADHTTEHHPRKLLERSCMGTAGESLKVEAQLQDMVWLAGPSPARPEIAGTTSWRWV
jgi:hypothetical protein